MEYVLSRLIMATALSLADTADASPAGSSAARTDPAAMPERVCEIRQRAWCITQADSIITDIPAWAQTDPDHTWRIHHRRYPDSDLVIFEPRGCRKALADTVEPIRFSHGVMWEGASWDEILVRLRKDGTCDLTLRVPVWVEGSPDWPFNEGRVNLVACKDEACTLNQPTIADLTDKYQSLRGSK
ncbi:hypothetical protein [Luteibacter sp. SG786]|uniref:hypothetical protein n=1 Tax=Luteibacter sp. SG786 TaxID=2587130 RepID=UPI001420ED4A|nr:hypothetical protein [Luteibacter sp. SG786]NII55166.1 hypothetical protein [Luteibacter sp. SG786]